MLIKNPHPLINTFNFLILFSSLSLYSLSLTPSHTRTHTRAHTHTHTHLDTHGRLYRSTGPMPPWLRCMYYSSMSAGWVRSVLACPPWSPVSLSAKPSGLYQTSPWGCLLIVPLGSSEVRDSLGSLLRSFKTLQLYQGVLTLCSSIVSSGKSPLSFSVGHALSSPPLSLQTGGRVWE